MPLRELQTHHFRNLAEIKQRFSSGVNLVHGDNGSGKSSLLEAIHYLGVGRSFRTHKHETVVAHGEDSLSVYGEVVSDRDEDSESSPVTHTHKLGISRNIRERRTTLRLDGENERSLSALAQHFPVAVIEPGSFDIVAGGPGRRRQYLDWAVFHVEHSFAALWQQCQKVISQRNQLLRSGKLDAALLRAWNRQYVELAQAVTQVRQHWFDRLVPLIEELVVELDAPWGSDLTLAYFRGWDRHKALDELLELHFDQERRAGHTLYGPNRCDVRIRIAQRPAAEVLSRGQQKTLVVLLKLAQGLLLQRERKLSCAFLLDDINAELDHTHQEILAQQLQRLGSQVFVTSIARPDPETLWSNTLTDLRMFHVEHGVLTQEI